MTSPLDRFRLEGAVAVVTGGAGHIGWTTARAFVEVGARVLLVDVDAKTEERARELGGSDVARGLAIDLGRTDVGRVIVDEALAAFGAIHVILNNAAFTGASGLPGYAVPFPEQTYEAWNAALQVNLSAPFLLAQAAQPELVRSGRGSIINVGSIYGEVGPNLRLYDGTRMGNPAAYGATKGGIIQLTRYLATVMSPHVRVNAVSPGGIARGQAASFVERYEALTPLGRMGTEDDLIGAFLFLASDASRYVTGQNLLVDGGWTVW